jgi:hypothetical protein
MYWGSFVDVPLILAKVGDRKELHAAFKNSAAKKNWIWINLNFGGKILPIS